MIRSALLLVVASLFAMSAHAVEIVVADNLVLSVNLKDGWILHLEAPDELVQEMAAHVAHEPAAAKATAEQIEKVTRKRLAANEAFVYHAASGAHLDIDFSPLEQGGSAPSSATLRSSAEFAAQSLEAEDDVTEMVWNVSSVKIDGSAETFLLSADYLQHDRPMTFRGYIGYVRQSWFFLYFTAPGGEPEVVQEMQTMLEDAEIRFMDR